MGALSMMEKEKWSDFARAMTDEQRRVILQNTKTTELQQELDRRTVFTTAKINQIFDVIDNNPVDEIDLVGMQKLLKELKGILT